MGFSKTDLHTKLTKLLSVFKTDQSNTYSMNSESTSSI